MRVNDAKSDESALLRLQNVLLKQACERKNVALKECDGALGLCQKVIKKYALRLQLGDAGWPKPEMRRATEAKELARIALQGT